MGEFMKFGFTLYDARTGLNWSKRKHKRKQKMTLLNGELYKRIFMDKPRGLDLRISKLSLKTSAFNQWIEAIF